jgi:uncharacterized Zn finger protein (UPF0148 family)
MAMLDRRCPACNRPVRGKQEVVTLKALTPADKKIAGCPHCKTPIRLSGEVCDLGGHFYETAKPFKATAEERAEAAEVDFQDSIDNDDYD